MTPDDPLWREEKERLEKALEVLRDPEAERREFVRAAWILEEAAKARRFPQLVTEAGDVMIERAREATSVEMGSKGEKALYLLRILTRVDDLRELADDPRVEAAVREHAAWYLDLSRNDRRWIAGDPCPECGGEEVVNVDRMVLRTGGPDKRIVTLWRCEGCDARLLYDSERPRNDWRVMTESAFDTWKNILEQCPRPRRATCGCRAHERVSRM